MQDGTVLHASGNWPTVIGADCIIGHNAHLEGAMIGDACLIGSMSTCLLRVVVGHSSLVGAAALLTEETEVPPLSRALGVPARISPHPDAPRFVAMVTHGAARYVNNAERYRADMVAIG